MKRPKSSIEPLFKKRSSSIKESLLAKEVVSVRKGVIRGTAFVLKTMQNVLLFATVVFAKMIRFIWRNMKCKISLDICQERNIKFPLIFQS